MLFKGLSNYAKTIKFSTGMEFDQKGVLVCSFILEAFANLPGGGVLACML